METSNNKLILPKPHNKRKFTSQSYSACHKWLDKHFNKANCNFCGSKRFVEWALKKDKVHDHCRDNYLMLCSSCHKRYDYTPERRAKLSASLKLVPHTEEWNKKATAHNKTFRHTDVSKKKMSEYRKKNPRPKDKITGRYV
jgi:hypothetical protein